MCHFKSWSFGTILGYQKTHNFIPINLIILAVKTYISNSRMSRNLNIMKLDKKIKIIYDEQKLLAKMDLKEEVFFRKTYRTVVTLNFVFIYYFRKIDK